MSKAYIGVGGNLGDVISTMNSAFDEIKQHQNIFSVRLSSFYESKPLSSAEFSDADQPLYINAVAELDTDLSPESLLDLLQKVEMIFGRVRTQEQWSSRTLDLDILLFDDRTISTDRLTVPHVGILERDFVLEPLFEIAPSLQIAGYGPLSDALKRCENRGLRKLNEAVQEKLKEN